MLEGNSRRRELRINVPIVGLAWISILTIALQEVIRLIFACFRDFDSARQVFLVCGWTRSAFPFLPAYLRPLNLNSVEAI
jgi:hypothetical protein